MACSRSSTLNLEVKYSFDFVNPEDLKLRLKSIFVTKTFTDSGLDFTRVIQDCEGVFKVQRGRVCTKTNIRSRERDDDGYLLGDSDIWKTLSSCILEEIEGVDKSNIRVSLDFKATEAVEMIHR